MLMNFTSAKYTKHRLAAGLCPDLLGRSLSAQRTPDRVGGENKGRRKRRKEGKGEGTKGKGEGRKGREGRGAANVCKSQHL